jgi:hypothetical protein
MNYPFLRVFFFVDILLKGSIESAKQIYKNNYYKNYLINKSMFINFLDIIFFNK